MTCTLTKGLVLKAWSPPNDAIESRLDHEGLRNTDLRTPNLTPFSLKKKTLHFITLNIFKYTIKFAGSKSIYSTEVVSSLLSRTYSASQTDSTPVLAGFLSARHKLKSCEGREPQPRNCLHKIRQ